MKKLLSTIRVICNAVNFVRGISLLTRPHVRFVVFGWKSDKTLFVTSYHSASKRRAGFPESKHNPQ